MAPNHFSNNKQEPKQSQRLPQFDWQKLRKAIEFYEREKLRYFPLIWGAKKPDISSWKPFQSRAPTFEELVSWFHEGKPSNIAIICGQASGGLVALCFNDSGGAPEFFGEELWNKLLTSTFITQSPRGHHVLLRSDAPIKSQFVRKDDEESWLEIRSDGNYIVAPPSLHPNGVLYQAIGVDSIAKLKNLASFIDEHLSQLGLKARGAREAPKGEPKQITERPERADKFNTLAIEKLLESCFFVQHCRDNATSLSEPHWWSLVHILAVFGKPGGEKIHQLSVPYPGYTEQETEQKIREALKAGEREIGPHTCEFVEKKLGFACPEDCQAKRLGTKSPAGMACRLVRIAPDAALPAIVCSGRRLRDESTDALQAMYQANTPERIFHRGGALCRISEDELDRPMIELLTEAALRGHMERSANFIKYNAKGEAFAAPPPLECVRDVQSLGGWQFPALLGITEAPVIRPNGTVLATPGYDSATHLYYAPAPHLVVPPIPENPTASEVSVATNLVLEVICDFPFVDEASHANAVGALMVTILRPLMVLAPMVVLDKPQPGTGASLLADVISIMATGRPAATMGDPRSEEECEKKLNSHLLEGRSLCIIDNVDGKLWSDTLARFLTSPYLSVRPLGRSADLRLRNSLTYVVTGNNIQLGGDLPRRCFWVRLNAQLARPWLRDDFRHPRLREWLTEKRGATLAAILTVARAWVVAGRPENPELLVLGSYEDFCSVVGNILEFMGIKGFLANLTAMYDVMDKDTPQWEAFLETWREVIGDVPVTVKELIKKLDDFEELSNSLPDNLATRDERNYSRRLGNALAKRAEVHHPNGLVLVKAGISHRATLWRVIQKITNSPGFSFKSELSELDSIFPHTEKLKKRNNIYIEGVGANSPNSLLDTKAGELDGDPWGEFLQEVENQPDG